MSEDYSKVPKWAWVDAVWSECNFRMFRLEKWLARHGWERLDYAGSRGTPCYQYTVYKHPELEGVWGIGYAVYKTLQLGLRRI